MPLTEQTNEEEKRGLEMLPEISLSQLKCCNNFIPSCCYCSLLCCALCTFVFIQVLFFLASNFRWSKSWNCNTFSSIIITSYSFFFFLLLTSNPAIAYSFSIYLDTYSSKCRSNSNPYLGSVIYLFFLHFFCCFHHDEECALFNLPGSFSSQ